MRTISVFFINALILATTTMFAQVPIGGREKIQSSSTQPQVRSLVELRQFLEQSLQQVGYSEQYANRIISTIGHWSSGSMIEGLEFDLRRHGMEGDQLITFLSTAREYMEVNKTHTGPINNQVQNASRTSVRFEFEHGKAKDPNPTMALKPQELIDALISDPTCKSFVTNVVLTATNPVMQIQAQQLYGQTALGSDGGLLILSSGDPYAPAQENDIDFSPEYCTGDLARIDIYFNITNPIVKSMSMKFDFYSYEFPEYVGNIFNDYVFAYWDQPITFDGNCTPQEIAQYCPSGTGCAVSTQPSSGLLTFDQESPCKPTNVNNTFFQPCNIIGCDNAPGSPGWNNLYGSIPGDDAV